tara:strand:- start:150 stop:581 length:432 start_codon:yes stop_codon:yes gene_type:complete
MIEYTLATSSNMTGEFPTMTASKQLKTYTQDTQRTLRPAEYRKLTGYTGKRARIEYAIYRQKAGNKGRTAAVAEIQDKDLKFDSRKTTAKGVTYTFVRPEFTQYSPTKSAAKASLANCTKDQKIAALKQLLQDPELAAEVGLA